MTTTPENVNLTTVEELRRAKHNAEVNLSSVINSYLTTFCRHTGVEIDHIRVGKVDVSTIGKRNEALFFVQIDVKL